MPSPDQDGRAARSKRTRRAIVDALLALIREGQPQPQAREVAERAGVSLRTVFTHFATLEDLHRASVERVTGLVLSLLTPIDPGQPIEARVESLTAQRARVHEEIGPIRRAASLRAASSPALAEADAYGRRASYEQLDRVFARELGALDARTRRRRRAVLDAVVGGEAWDVLRRTHGLSVEAARLAVGEAVRVLLAEGPVARAAAGVARATGDDRRRVRAAERSLADVDRRIERLVAAVEAGSPADLVAPRLTALRSARRDAEQALADARAGAPRDGPRA